MLRSASASGQSNAFLETARTSSQACAYANRDACVQGEVLEQEQAIARRAWFRVNRTEAGIRKIKARAAAKVWTAPAPELSLDDLTTFYSIPCRGDLDEWVDFARKRFPGATSKQRAQARKATGQHIVPAEICYLDKRCGRFNSRDFANVSEWKPKREVFLRPAHWINAAAFAVEYLTRFKDRVLPTWFEPAPLVGPDPFEKRFGRPWKAGKEWRKPTCEEEVRYAALAA